MSKILRRLYSSPAIPREVGTKLQTSVHISQSTDPYFNLAYEDWIFRKTDPQEISLFCYRNRPSIIIGRNQNPWKEINFAKLNGLGIPFIRRKSGGGTVYHDLGNTNYCVFVPREQFERSSNAQLVSRALNALQIPSSVNVRNDIVVDSFKVSGSAFKLRNAKAYHHGTMLINAKLQDLKGVLHSEKDALITKGVESVPSPVGNLQQWNPNITHESFVNQVVDEFRNTYGHPVSQQIVDESILQANEYVKEVYEELQSWKWRYGQSPEFFHTMRGNNELASLALTIHARHGLITSIDALQMPELKEKEVLRIFDALVGTPYGDCTPARATLPKDIFTQQVLDWLSAEF